MHVWTSTVFECLICMHFLFLYCTCSAPLSMFHMEKRSRNILIIIIIIIIIARSVNQSTLISCLPSVSMFLKGE